MKKVLLCLILSLTCIGSVFSQFDAQFTQYMFNQTAFNPAAVGESGLIQVTGQHRIQWAGFTNGPQTTVFSINSPLKIGSSYNGIGIKFLNDKIGGFVNQTAHLQYAYKKTIGEGVLSIGADLGFVSLKFNGDSVRKITLGTYHVDATTDTEIPSVSVTGTSFDMNLGVYYSSPKFYAGISYSHLNRPLVTWTDFSEINVNGTLYCTGGYNYTLPDTKYVFKPSGLFKTNFSTFQLDISTRLEYDNKYWGGIAYRIDDAVSVLAGINITGGLAIGFSYDLTTSKISQASYGSPELMMIYSFEYLFNKSNSKYKSIRIL